MGKRDPPTDSHLTFPLLACAVHTGGGKGRQRVAPSEVANLAGLAEAGVAEAGKGRVGGTLLLITLFACLFTGSSGALLGAVPCSLPNLLNKHLLDPIPNPPLLPLHIFLSLPEPF